LILVWLLALPLLGGALAWPAERLGPRAPGIVSLAVMAAGLAAMPGLLGATPARLPGLPGAWLDGFDRGWIDAFGIHFRLAIDGMSLLLVALTEAIGLLAIIVAWDETARNTGFFHANLLWSLAGAIGVFIAVDLFTFFFFWELMLVPMYFVIAIWGHAGRRRAAIKFFLFTQGSGLLMLVAILALAFLYQDRTGTVSFDYGRLLTLQPDGAAGFLIMLGFFIALLVKLPGFPVHSWLPETHTEAPTAGSLILASILLKTAGYALLRFAVPLFEGASHTLAPYAMWLGVAGIIYGAVLAYAQSDLKRLVAYSSIGHMGFVLLGIYSFDALAWQGTIILMLAHGVSTGALFIVVGRLQRRLHSRDLDRMGGLWASLPRLSAWGTFFVIAAMGLPGLGNFIGEFLILRGTFAVAPLPAIAAAIGLIPAAIYSLIAIQRAFHGAPAAGPAPADFGARETGLILVLAAAIVWLGVAPQPVLNEAAPGLANLRPAAAPP
jgi:NADH-quinone oxidoreductase subunit M